MYITKCNANRRTFYCLIERKSASPLASFCSQNSQCLLLHRVLRHAWAPQELHADKPETVLGMFLICCDITGLVAAQLKCYERCEITVPTLG